MSVKRGLLTPFIDFFETALSVALHKATLYVHPSYTNSSNWERVVIGKSGTSNTVCMRDGLGAGHNAGDMLVGAIDFGNLRFVTNNSIKMYVDTNGNLTWFSHSGDIGDLAVAGPQHVYAEQTLSLTTCSNSNGQMGQFSHLTELTTINAAAFTDTAIQFPADSIGLGVSVRVTAAIPTAVTFDIGVAGATTRYNPGAGAVSTALNSTGTGAGTTNPSIYSAATSVRITPNAIPAANSGRVRVTLYYFNMTAPTS